MAKIRARICVITAAATMIAGAIACGSEPPTPQAAPEPPRTVQSSPTERPTATPNAAPPPTSPTTPAGAQPSNQVPTPRPTTVQPISPASITPAPTSAQHDASAVHVAPRVETPTATPLPEPTATGVPPNEPTVRWLQFSEDEYRALLPDPNLGVAWGREFKDGPGCPRGQEGNVTPAGVKERYPDTYRGAWAAIPQEMDAGDALETVIEYRYPQATREIRGTKIGVTSVCMQWALVHPEIPLMAVIVEVVAQKPDGTGGWTPDVWRTGAHYIVKDTHTNSAGTFWRTSFELEKLGPTIVEQGDCAGLLMPLRRDGRC